MNNTVLIYNLGEYEEKLLNNIINYTHVGTIINLYNIDSNINIFNKVIYMYNEKSVDLDNKLNLINTDIIYYKIDNIITSDNLLYNKYF